jgi:hypothetical protein
MLFVLGSFVGYIKKKIVLCDISYIILKRRDDANREGIVLRMHI